MEDEEKPRIARASAADIGDFIRLGEAANLSPWSAQNYVDELKLESSILLKLVDTSGTMLGFVVGRIITGGEGTRNDAEIYNIAVIDSEKRRGRGQMLFDSFIEAAAQGNTGVVWLEVRESNYPARSFYQKSGFVSVQTRKGFYANPTENAILMKLDLYPTQPSATGAESSTEA